MNVYVCICRNYISVDFFEFLNIGSYKTILLCYKTQIFLPFFLIFKLKPRNKLFFLSGVLALFSALPAFVIGPLLYYTGICSDKEAIRIKKIKYVHTACGVFCFAMSSICYCTSFFKPSFQKWAGLIEIRELPFVLSACVLFYTIIVIRGVDWQMQYHNNMD